MAGLSKTKTKPNPKLKFELKFGAELCNILQNYGEQVMSKQRILRRSQTIKRMKSYASAYNERSPGKKIDVVRFGMRIRQTFKSALERQVCEAVSIKLKEEDTNC